MIIVEYLKPTLTFERMSDISILIVLCVRGHINYFVILKNQEKIQKIIQSLPGFYPLEEQEEFQVNQRLKHTRIPSIIASIVPIIDWIRKVSLGSPADYRKMIFSTDFKIFSSNEFLYAIYNLWPLIVIQVGLLCIVTYDALVHGIIVVLTVELQKLKSEILDIKMRIPRIFVPPTVNLQSILKKSSKILKHSNSKHILPSILKIVDKHVHLCEINDKLEEIFASTFLVHFIEGSIILCFTEFNAIVHNDDVIILIIIAVSVFLQNLSFFMQCYYCQLLKDANLSISDAIYDCKWEEIEDIKVKKHLLMILMRSQKSKTLTCWKFAENSFELFGSVSFGVQIALDVLDGLDLSNCLVTEKTF